MTSIEDSFRRCTSRRCTVCICNFCEKLKLYIYSLMINLKHEYDIHVQRHRLRKLSSGKLHVIAQETRSCTYNMIVDRSPEMSCKRNYLITYHARCTKMSDIGERFLFLQLYFDVYIYVYYIIISHNSTYLFKKNKYNVMSDLNRYYQFLS